jgi:hypothetical protein
MNYSLKTYLITMSAIFVVSCLLAAELSAAPPVAKTSNAQRSPASVMSAAPIMGGGTKEIGEEMKVTGQSRSLQMGMLLQKDKDKLTFGTPRTNYKDKISNKTTNF